MGVLMVTVLLMSVFFWNGATALECFECKDTQTAGGSEAKLVAATCPSSGHWTTSKIEETDSKKHAICFIAVKYDQGIAVNYIAGGGTPKSLHTLLQSLKTDNVTYPTEFPTDQCIQKKQSNSKGIEQIQIEVCSCSEDKCNDPDQRPPPGTRLQTPSETQRADPSSPKSASMNSNENNQKSSSYNWYSCCWSWYGSQNFTTENANFTEYTDSTMNSSPYTDSSREYENGSTPYTDWNMTTESPITTSAGGHAGLAVDLHNVLPADSHPRKTSATSTSTPQKVATTTTMTPSKNAGSNNLPTENPRPGELKNNPLNIDGIVGNVANAVIALPEKKDDVNNNGNGTSSLTNIGPLVTVLKDALQNQAQDLIQNVKNLVNGASFCSRANWILAAVITLLLAM